MLKSPEARLLSYIVRVVPVVPVIRQPVGGQTQQQIMCVAMATKGWGGVCKQSYNDQKQAADTCCEICKYKLAYYVIGSEN